MILESLDYISKIKIIKRIHIVHLIDDEIQIGRNGSNDIIDKDLTMSRNHAVLKYNHSEGEVIQENRSRTYDTLVLIKGNINE